MRKKKRRVTNSNKSVRFSWSDSRVALQEQLKIRTADFDVNDDIDDGTNSDDVDIDIDSDDVDIDNDALILTFIVASIKKCTASKKSKNQPSLWSYLNFFLPSRPSNSSEPELEPKSEPESPELATGGQKTCEWSWSCNNNTKFLFVCVSDNLGQVPVFELSRCWTKPFLVKKSLRATFWSRDNFLVCEQLSSVQWPVLQT